MGRSPAAVDLVIVGAGAAGLAAAKTAREEGLRFVLLEAKERIGGRCHTESATFGFPFDRGAYWMHSASLHPFPRLARELGFTYRKRGGIRQVFMGDRWATETELRERARFYDRNFEAVHAEGRAGRDVAVSEVIEADGRWGPLLAQWIAAIAGVDPEDASTLDFASYRDTDENWPVREGFGALVARWGADLPVELGAPASRIDWGGPGVRVETPKGSVAAGAAVLTASTAVLASGRIRFDPPLPGWKRDAIEAIPMGKANKIALAFDKDVFGLPERVGSATLLTPTPETLGFQVRPFGHNIAVGFVGGRFCSELERAGERAMTDFALEKLKAMFGAAIARRLTGSACTAWEGDPWIGGGYTAARPGRAHRRADLARPLEERLFFAGEAASREFFSTVHGAYFTGAEAARAAARALRGGRPA